MTNKAKTYGLEVNSIGPCGCSDSSVLGKVVKKKRTSHTFHLRLYPPPRPTALLLLRRSQSVINDSALEDA